jgi:hypothetical protein
MTLLIALLLVRLRGNSASDIAMVQRFVDAELLARKRWSYCWRV